MTTRIFLDIETIRQEYTTAELAAIEEPGAEHLELYREIYTRASKEETLIANGPDEVRKHIEKTALNPYQLRVCCIGYAIDDGEPQTISDKECTKESQGRILKQFNDAVSGHIQNVKWVTWNGDNFDFPALRSMAFDYLLPLFCWLPDTRYDDTSWDLKKEFAGTAWKNMPSMEKMVRYRSPFECKTDMDGSMVGDYWRAGRYEEIADYCASDVRAMQQLVERIDKLRGVPV